MLMHGYLISIHSEYEPRFLRQYFKHDISSEKHNRIRFDFFPRCYIYLLLLLHRVYQMG